MITHNFISKKKLMTKVHFNRIEMMRGSDYVWTVHTSEGCHQVKEVSIHTVLTTVYNPKGIQPRAFFKGRSKVEVHDNIATLW